MTKPLPLEELKVGDMVEIIEGNRVGHTGARGWFHGITLDGRYDIELGANLGYSHRHIYVSKSDFRKLPDRKEE